MNEPTEAERLDAMKEMASLRERGQPDGDIGRPKTLANQVDDLACKAINLEWLAGEMLATVKLNHQRGYLIATNDEGKLNLAKIIAKWERELSELTAKG